VESSLLAKLWVVRSNPAMGDCYAVFGQFLENYRRSPKCWPTFFTDYLGWDGLYFGHFLANSSGPTVTIGHFYISSFANGIIDDQFIILKKYINKYLLV
jgi:hypothetical protein